MGCYGIAGEGTVVSLTQLAHFHSKLLLSRVVRYVVQSKDANRDFSKSKYAL